MIGAIDTYSTYELVKRFLIGNPQEKARNQTCSWMITRFFEVVGT